jgi:hypothetical protein
MHSETSRLTARMTLVLAAALSGGCAHSPAPKAEATSRVPLAAPRATPPGADPRLDIRTVSGADLPAPRALCFRDRSTTTDPTTAAIARRTAGILAQRGFTVTDHTPNVLVEMRSVVTLADRMGSSRVYRGSATVDVFSRATPDGGARLLGSEQFECRGDRKFDDAQARESLTDRLAQRAANWLAPAVAADSLGVADTRFRAEQAFRELDAEIAGQGGN